jgi:hypothetical protein
MQSLRRTSQSPPGVHFEQNTNQSIIRYYLAMMRPSRLPLIFSIDVVCDADSTQIEN